MSHEHATMTVMNFVKQNAWAILISAFGVASTLATTSAVYGIRIDNLEEQNTELSATVAALSQTTQTNNLAIQVSLAKIQTDLEYLKSRLR